MESMGECKVHVSSALLVSPPRPCRRQSSVSCWWFAGLLAWGQWLVVERKNSIVGFCGSSSRSDGDVEAETVQRPWSCRIIIPVSKYISSKEKTLPHLKWEGAHRCRGMLL
jgi:hypothetical protein